MSEEVNENTQAVNALLAPVKLALRVTTNAFDSELESKIEAAKQDLGVAGVLIPSEITPLVTLAVITYVKMNFGDPDNYDRWKMSYDEQKAQLVTCTGYTNWLGVDNGQV